MKLFLPQLHTSSTPANIEDDDILTPKAPRGKRSDLTEKDLEEFVNSFASASSAAAATAAAGTDI
jgi:hypothetical protein